MQKNTIISGDDRLDAIHNSPLLVMGNNKLFRVKIVPDESSFDPREDFSNLGRMFCAHRRHSLGDERLTDEMFEDLRQRYKDNDNNEDEVILPLYLFDHSGLSMSTHDFRDPWDSGFVGFIVADKTDWKNFHGEDTPWDKEKAKMQLLGEVKTYDRFLRGEVYRTTIEKWAPNSDGIIPNVEDDCQWEDVEMGVCGSLFYAEDIVGVIEDEAGKDFVIISDEVTGEELEGIIEPVRATVNSDTVAVNCGVCGGEHTVPLYSVNGMREGYCTECGTFVRVKCILNSEGNPVKDN